MRRALAALSVAAVGAGALAGGATQAAPVRAQAGTTSTADGARDVMFAGNNWAGTATVIDVHTRKRIKTLNIVPDREAELQEIYASPDRLAFYLAIQQGVGEGHDQYVDDMFTTRDGTTLAVSRPSFADVVWIDLASGRIVAEQQMDGYRTDHMGVSPDGRRLVVSDSTDRSAHEYVMGGKHQPGTGKRLRTFESGDTPHENSYTEDGERIFHASIGRVYTPFDYEKYGPVPANVVHDTVKADRWLQVVDNDDFGVLKRWDIGVELEEAGYPDMSSAVRPMALSPDERTAYLQVSFLHGFVEFRLDRRDPSGGGDYTLGGKQEPRNGVVTRVAHLPVSEEVQQMPREQYVLDSAHHGIAMNDRGTRLCVAGTMSDYAAIVERRSFRHEVFRGHGRYLENRTYKKPYWATTSEHDGNCWVSMSGSDLVTVIDYATKRVLAEVPVGDHPQRVRDGVVAPSVLAAWRRGAAGSKPDLSPVPISAEQRAAAEAYTRRRLAAIG
ncbi:MAG: serine/threonine protein kinase [Actinomycetota bacterium]|nr:serine/threonine protein kinase [Actinomycetota bacterium]